MKINLKPLKLYSFKFWRVVCTWWRSLADLPRKFREFWHKDRTLKSDFTPEMEAIMTRLIRSTVGTGGELDREFRRLSARFDKEEKPIGEREARELILSLLKVAIANRDLINGRIEHSVEFGSLYYRYYSKLQTVYDLTVDANFKREEMAEAQRDYFFAYNLYNNVCEMTYAPEAIKQFTGKSYAPPPPATIMDGGKTI